MPKVKIARKSTIVDMTAMCDVSFLLLTFFILTAKFRPNAAVAVDVPQARSQTVIKDALTILIDKEGRAYISVKESGTRVAMLDNMIEKFGDRYPQLKTLTDKQKRNFSLIDTWGTPIEDMPRVLDLNGGEFTDYQEKLATKEGSVALPYDSLHNQLADWILAGRYANRDLLIAVKSDKNTNISYVKEVVKTLTTKLDIHRFNLITTLSGGNAPAEGDDKK